MGVTDSGRILSTAASIGTAIMEKENTSSARMTSYSTWSMTDAITLNMLIVEIALFVEIVMKIVSIRQLLSLIVDILLIVQRFLQDIMLILTTAESIGTVKQTTMLKQPIFSALTTFFMMKPMLPVTIQTM